MKAIKYEVSLANYEQSLAICEMVGRCKAVYNAARQNIKASYANHLVNTTYTDFENHRCNDKPFVKVVGNRP